MENIVIEVTQNETHTHTRPVKKHEWNIIKLSGNFKQISLHPVPAPEGLCLKK